MGRPKKPPDEKLTERRTIGFRPAVLKAIETACATTEIPIDTWIRAAVLEKLYRDGWWKPPPERFGD
jgi:hypothetical protein